MKPWGMTADFRITRPTMVEDKVFEAVEEAINSGWTPARLITEIQQDWAIYLSEKSNADDRAFQKILKEK